jgi:DNA-binding XRE family transcriptional regulator
LQPELQDRSAQSFRFSDGDAQPRVQRASESLTTAFPLESFVPMRRAIADWSACGLAVAILALGGLVVVKPAVDHWDDVYRGDPFKAGTTTQIVQKTAGKKVDRTRTTTTEDSSSFAERLLGDSGTLFARLLLVALVAFLAAAVLHRALLGEYGLRRVDIRRPRRASAEATETPASEPANGERPTANGQPDDEAPTLTLAPGIAKLVATRREALGLSQRELAKRAGISHTVISRVEGGEHSPSPKTLERLAEALR